MISVHPPLDEAGLPPPTAEATAEPMLTGIAPYSDVLVIETPTFATATRGVPGVLSVTVHE